MRGVLSCHVCNLFLQDCLYVSPATRMANRFQNSQSQLDCSIFHSTAHGSDGIISTFVRLITVMPFLREAAQPALSTTLAAALNVGRPSISVSAANPTNTASLLHGTKVPHTTDLGSYCDLRSQPATSGN